MRPAPDTLSGSSAPAGTTTGTAAPALHILVIDDEPDLRTLYELTLLREGYRVDTAGSVEDATAQLAQSTYDLVITDMRLPDGSGIDLLLHLRAQQRPERSIVITAFGSAENAVESLKAGAFDYLTKPVDLPQFRAAVKAAIQVRSTVAATPEATPLRAAPPASGQQALQQLVGDSPALRAVRERVTRAAPSMAPVLVIGESGTGKELVARALHANSHRHSGPWVAVNCGAIPDDLLEAEFFGARKGAYTGASHDRIGFFQAANGGTLFLDEIGELPLNMQAKLLRAIQERRIRPLGASQEEPVNVRIVSATHKNLPAEVQAGRFRQDLYYRLNVIDIIVPPLRERRQDLDALCTALLRKIAADNQQTLRPLSKAALAALGSMEFPGNVRELENLLHRAMALSDAAELELENVTVTVTDSAAEASPTAAPPTALNIALPPDLQDHLDAQERLILLRALQETGYNRTLAAKRLGLTLRQIRYRMERLKIGDGVE